jgi:hypothetical protein
MDLMVKKLGINSISSLGDLYRVACAARAEKVRVNAYETDRRRNAHEE